eukprot:g22957.t1
MVPATALVALSVNLKEKLPLIIALVLGETCFFSYQAPITALSMSMIPVHTRARGSSLQILLCHVLGDVISPPIIGKISVSSSLRVALQLPWVAVLIAGRVAKMETTADSRELVTIVVAQLTKTKMKTAMCRAFARGACRATNCKFAHAEEELRVSPTVYKTQLCHFFARGHCKKGDRCRHAHGPKELRPFESSLPTAGARAESFREDGGEPSPRTPQKTPTPSTCSPSPMKVQLPQLRTLCNLGESPLKEVLELLRTALLVEVPHFERNRTYMAGSERAAGTLEQSRLHGKMQKRCEARKTPSPSSSSSSGISSALAAIPKSRFWPKAKPKEPKEPKEKEEKESEESFGKRMCGAAHFAASITGLFHQVSMPATPAFRAIAADPFGIDLSLELLSKLPAVEPRPSMTSGSSPGFSPPVRQAGHEKSKRGFGLCIFKARTKSSELMEKDGSPYFASDLTDLISVGAKRVDTWLAGSACRTAASVAPPARLSGVPNLAGNRVFVAMAEE